MGTRSLTIFLDEDDKEIVVMYRQFDGYPTGHGAELAKFLKKLTVVNGLPCLPKGKKVRYANGAGCLAAQVVAKFKGNTPGNIYLHPAGTRDCWEEWVYTIKAVAGKPIHLQARTSGGTIVFDGPVQSWRNAKAYERKADDEYENEIKEEADANL